MNRQTHFDIGGGQRDPPTIPDYGYRGAYGIQKPSLQSYSPQSAQHQHPPLQPQLQPQAQPQAALGPGAVGAPGAPGATGGFDGGRANAFGYNPYGQYTYNPYGYRYPYGWSRPATQPANPWSPFSLGFPFNLFGLGGGGGGGGGGSAAGGAYRPWWSGNRWGLFF